MAKLAQSNSKYTIHARFKADGVVEKSDVIGAIFGQTEGLLGTDMDLRELQRTGRIGRIEVDLDSQGGETEGHIEIPSSLDASETSLIAATLETIERIGPCETKIEVEEVEDVRTSKREYLLDRAKDILTDLEEDMPEKTAMAEELMGSVRSGDLSSYKGLTCGPEAVDADEIVLCEGRADVINLLSNGIKNALAVGGTNIPDAAVEVAEGKKVTVFLDGDRGGDLILKEMEQKGIDIDDVARAPKGKEVEELTQKEVWEAIRDKRPFKEIDVDDSRSKKSRSKKKGGKSKSGKDSGFEEKQKLKKMKRLSEEDKENMAEAVEELTGTRAAYLYDDDWKLIGKIPVKEMFGTMKEVDDIHTIVLDGHVDQKLVDFAKSENVRNVVAMRVDKGVKIPKTMLVLTGDDLEENT